MIENKKLDKQVSEIADEKLKEVTGGWTAKDTADYDDLTSKWQKAIIMKQIALRRATESGDSAAIQEAQAAYDSVLNEPNLCEMRRLYYYWDRAYGETAKEAAKSELSAFWSTFDYQYYSNWLDTLI